MSETNRKLINHILVELFNHILRLEEKNLQAKGVTLSMNEVHVLEAIQKAEMNTMTKIAEYLHVTVGTLTISMNRLVEKGYVKRDSDPKDRRKVLINLTENGMDVLEVHTQFHQKMVKKLFDEFNIEKEDVLIDSLTRLRDFFYEMF